VPSGWKQTASTTVASVLVRWRTNGEIMAYFPCDIPRNVSLNYSPAPGKPGLYCITIEQDDGMPLIYIGESEYLPKRLGEYTRRLHEKKPEGTSARLASATRVAACGERRATVDVATTGKIILQSEDAGLRMLAEAAAVLDEERKHDPRAYVLNKALDDGHRWIGPAHPLDDPVARRPGPGLPLARQAVDPAS
jgi:hypothetical protein